MTALAPFPYYGGKSRLLPFLLEHLPPAVQFVDLFGGSAVVSLGVVGRYRKIVYNDIDRRLWNFFRVLRDFPAQLQDKIDKTPASREEYAHCAQPDEDPVEDARRVFVRVNQSFSNLGLARKTSGSWMTQPGPGQSVARSFARRSGMLRDIARTMRTFDIENLDWREVVKRYDHKDTLFFADPPYDLASRSGGKGYANEMTPADHRDLVEALRAADGSAVVCGYRSPVYDAGFKDWKRVEKPITCSNSAAKTGGTGDASRVETLWIKP